MAPWILPVASLIANKQQEREARAQMRQRIMQQYAQSMGAPSYEMDVANFNSEMKQRNGWGSLLPLISSILNDDDEDDEDSGGDS